MTDQTRPSWDDAPLWARWLSQNGNGEWYWDKNEPFWNDYACAYIDPKFERCEFAGAGETRFSQNRPPKEPRP